VIKGKKINIEPPIKDNMARIEEYQIENHKKN
jgi:hypothetical protein